MAAPLRALLVRLGLARLCQVKWTRRLLDECLRSIDPPKTPAEVLESLRQQGLTVPVAMLEEIHGV